MDQPARPRDGAASARRRPPRLPASGALALALGLGLSVAGCAAADDGDDAGAAGPASVAVVAADGTPLGHVALETACGPEADTRVRRGLALLHNMTYTEAEAEFRAAAEAEPECAIAHWGVAMTFLHPLWPDVVPPDKLEEGRRHLDRAREASIRSARDDAFIAALAGYYEGDADRPEAERLAAFEAGWAAAHEAFPDDPETTAFHALALLSTAPGDDKTYAHQERAGELLEKVLEAVPQHPGGHHYTIHAYDFPPLADQALETARSYGQLAPDNAHALHMTSHIYTRLGLWQESMEFNRRSADAAWARPMDGQVSRHYLHAIDYLMYAYLQAGRDDAARELLADLQGLGEMYDHTATAYSVAAIPARWALEHRDWEAARGLADGLPGTVDWEKYPQCVAIPVFAEALAAARTGELEAAHRAVGRLAELRDAAAELPGSYDWGTQVEVQRLAAEAWIQFAAGETDEALRLARQAAELEGSTEKSPVTPGVVLPARELYADMLLELERYEEAQRQYELSMERSPNRFRSLLGAADSARLAGRSDDAREHYERLLEMAGDSSRPEVARVREHLGT